MHTRDRVTAAVLLCSMAFQCWLLPANPSVTLPYFAQNDTVQSAGEIPVKAAPAEAEPAAVEPTAWQPAAADEHAPLAPPDDVNPVFQGPIPGIDDAVGNCLINGEVSDAVSLNPVAGAFVDVLGTGRTAETDAQGRFTIVGLPAGNFTLEATKLGYSTESAVVTTLEGQPAEARFGLRAKPTDDSTAETMLEEETIVGEYQGESQGDFNLSLETSASVTSGISKEDFTKTGVSDAAGAVGKVAGANIVGGKFAVVRGLADRYVTTLFNGAAISSADPSRKAVQLDIFPTTAIQGIDVNKTYLPSLPGDFGGGTIQINSLNIPHERVIEAKYKIGWNNTFGDRMLVHPNREPGFWGDVDNPIPDGLLWKLDADGNPASFNEGGRRVAPPLSTNNNNSNNNPLQRQAAIDEAKRQQEAANSTLPKVRELEASQSWLPKETKPEAPQSFSLVYGDRLEISDGVTAGFIAAFQHATSDQVNEFGDEARLTAPARYWTEESYAREVDWSFYLGGGIQIGENHELSFTWFDKHIATDNITHGTDFTVEGERFGGFGNNANIIGRYGASAVYKREFWTIEPVTRDTEIAQVGGKHSNDIGTTLTWRLTDSLARESRPHTSTFNTSLLDFTDPLVAAEAARNPGFTYNPSLGKIATIEHDRFSGEAIRELNSVRETQAIEEEANEISAEIKQIIALGEDGVEGRRFEFSVGANDLNKTRTQQGRIYFLRNDDWENAPNRNPPAWWTGEPGIAPFSPGAPLNRGTFPDGSPLPTGFRSLGEFLAANPDRIADHFNGYGSERTGPVPGTGTGQRASQYVRPDAPYYINGSGLEVRNVDSGLRLQSLYASAIYHGDFWRLGGGGRWETENKSYEVAALPLTSLTETSPGRFGTLSTSAFIPSVFGSIDVLPETTTLNSAWSHTVARPTFHEFLPIESVDQETGIERRGNPLLTETSIDNFDASVDLKITENFTGRVSGFHKNLADPIVVVQRVDNATGSNFTTYQNGDSGTITGVEIEGRWKHPDHPYSLAANYSYISSSLEYQVNSGDPLNPLSLETRFPYQPSQILNLTLGWEPAESPWSAFLTANFTDEYPTILRSDPVAYDVWLKPQFTLDLLLARRFEMEHAVATVTLGLRNLLDGGQVYEYRGGPGGNDPLNGLVYTEDQAGRSVYLELKAEF